MVGVLPRYSCVNPNSAREGSGIVSVGSYALDLTIAEPLLPSDGQKRVCGLSLPVLREGYWREFLVHLA